MKNSTKHIVRFISVFVAVLLLNISIFSTFSSAPKSKGIYAYTILPNNIESFFELIAEVCLGFDNLLVESEKDNSPINEEIKVAEYIQPKINYLKNSTTELLNNFGVYICPKYSFVFEINPPPPKA
ncbi:MAG: hypothetical protein ACXWDO_00130 [Bacteroidia bacterium]